MPKTLKNTAISAALFVVLGIGTQLLLPPTSGGAPVSREPVKPATITRATTAATTAPTGTPFSIEPAMLWEIANLPRDLNDTITASLHSRTEIIAVRHLSKVPLEPMAPDIRDIWCITIYPSALITLYVERYVARKDGTFVLPGDYVPGKQDTGTIDHFFAFRRGEGWELYNPGIYNWTRLGC